MAHYQQLKFVSIAQATFPEYFSRTKVLEVGSWNTNGSARQFFNECTYLGVDIAAGNDVDLVCPGQMVEYPSNYFDIILSCECFEHNPYWLETFTNMLRMLRPGGLCIISCASIGRGEHGTQRCQKNASLSSESSDTYNYYRNLDKNDFACIDLHKHFQKFSFYRNIYSKDLYLLGIKKGDAGVDCLEERFLSVAAQMKTVTTDKNISFPKTLLAYTSWFLKYYLAKTVGEKNYHDIKYYLKTLSRGVRGK